MQSIIKTSTSSDFRESLTKRKKKSDVVRSTKQKKNNDRYIANSFLGLNLKTKTTIDVSFELNNFHCFSYSWQKSISSKKFVSDLIISYKKLLHSFDFDFDKEAFNKINERKIVFYMISDIKQLVDNRYKLEIEYNSENDECFFVLFDDDIKHQQCWSSIEICHVVKKLRRNSKNMHDLFLSLIYSLSKNIEIQTWFQSTFASVQEYIKELAIDKENGSDEEDRLSLLKSMMLYDTGKAGQYKRLIQSANCYSFEQYDFLLSNLRRNHPITKLLYLCLDLLKMNLTIKDIDYYNDVLDDDNEMLCVHDQFAICWKFGDNVTTELQEHIDTQAAEFGVKSPCVAIQFNKDFDVVDWNKEELKIDYMKHLQSFFLNAFILIKEYVK